MSQRPKPSVRRWRGLGSGTVHQEESSVQTTLNHRRPMHVAAAAALSAAALLVAACGGGGGSSGSGSLPNRAPTVSVKLAGEAVLQAATVFDTSGTADPDGSIASRSWAYGDGSTGTADSHIYTATGTYTATLTVSDNLGATSSQSLSVTVAKCSADGLSLAVNSPQHAAVCLQTSLGELVIELFPAQAPITVANFLAYVDAGFYDGTLVHRVVPGFVFQAGGYGSGLVAKATQAPIALESANGLSNSQYTLAMARTGAPNSATSQFFVNAVDNSLCLNRGSTCPGTDPNGYAVFGQLLATQQRQAVVDAILAVATTTKTDSNNLRLTNVPASELVIRSAVRVP